jgi:hypothetical protein
MRAAALLVAIVLAIAMQGCGKSASASDPDLRQAEKVARHLTSVRHLRKSVYATTMQTGKPSELVSFLFSDMGVAEWPEADEGNPAVREQHRATRTPMAPGNVALVARNPDPRAKRQVVLKADDDKGELVAEGYADPARPPVFTERWPMPEVGKASPPR